MALIGLAPPAVADHTNPGTRLAPTDSRANNSGMERGAGDWRHIRNFRGGGNQALNGGGTDLEFFRPAGSEDLFGSFGTLGQDNAGNATTPGAIGQRIIRLLDNGQVKPEWVADHGSGHCQTDNTSVTGLQHDTQVAKLGKITLLTDTTDAVGRCHDDGGGGIEIIAGSRVHQDTYMPREVHMVRFPGTTHTNTVDKRFPWIVYSSNADFMNRNWIEVMNMRSCFGTQAWNRAERRRNCRPVVSRIHLQDSWTKQRDQDSGELEPGSATCHDITFAKGRLYCAALNSTLILDVSDLIRPDGTVWGETLNCPVIAGTLTSAKVTDCSQTESAPQRAIGWRFLDTFQHPGRQCGPVLDNRNCNSNTEVPSDQGVSVSHESDPTPDENFMFVTDERGGGVVPPGATCDPNMENPIGNGGAHAFDISNPRDIKYAKTPSGDRAVYISEPVVNAPTFCDIHVIEQIPGEQRFIAAYYTQGIKIVDYFVNEAGRLQFHERASFALSDTNVWSAEDFKIRRNANGTRTYFIATDDIHRGIDIVSWTGRPNLNGASPPPNRSNAAMTNAGLAGLSALTLAAAAAYRRRRNRLDQIG
jgi:hypothetical protein